MISNNTRSRWSRDHHGEKNPMFGKHHTEAARRKIGEAQLGKSPTEETRKKLSEVHLGIPFSEDHRRKIGEANSGEKNYLFGKHPTESHRRNLSESRFGERNPRWNGGTSFEPYCPKFTKEFKERVRTFFGYQCIECNALQNGKKLHVHHVNFNKNTCCDKTEPLFVPLCDSCHPKTNNNRDYWEQHFTEIINNYYQGRCYLSNDEMTQLSCEIGGT